MRPLGELLSELPVDLLSFEVEHGISLRARMLFEPLAQRAAAERAILEELAPKLARRQRH